MRTIEIQHIGPIVDTGKIPVSQIVLLIGEQSTGKSTFMKILCFCMWLEKVVMTSSEKTVLYDYTHYNRFYRELKKFHHFTDDFFCETSHVSYQGEALSIEYHGMNRNAKLTLNDAFAKKRHNAKLSFLPSERNLLSTIQNIESLYRSKDVDVLFNYILEWGEARAHFDSEHPLNLVFTDRMQYHYETETGDVITLPDGRSHIKPYHASSGVQSALPIQVLATYLASEVGAPAKISPIDFIRQIGLSATGETNVRLLNQALQEVIDSGQTQKAAQIPALDAALKRLQDALCYKSFHLFVEELEQNLFPKAQFDVVRMLVSLLVEAGRKSPPHPSTLFLTSHSPYVLTALNIVMLASAAHAKNAAQVEKMGLAPCVLPQGSVTAYSIIGGQLESLVDTEYGFIRGDYLDSVSEEVDDLTYRLNRILYADEEEA